jgi:4-hydroxy-3-polyprenylbenzoate decarboxylase
MDLREFTRLLSQNSELVSVDQPLDPHLEIAALSALATAENGPALLFVKPVASRFPILTNALASPRRLTLALNQADLDGFGNAAHNLLEQQSVRESDLPINDHPACQEVQCLDSKANFSLLPAMTFWPGDAGPCLTAAVIVTRHPETGQINAGIYRVQIIDHTRAILGWHPGSGAEEHFNVAKRLKRPLEVAIALGAPPAVTLAASFPLPQGVDEFHFAAHFCRAPLEMAGCKTVKLLVPADSQFVLEGYVDPTQLATEGPFANHAGRQTTARKSPIFQLKAITHVSEPIFQAIAIGAPPSESCWMGKAFEAILRRQIMACFADVRDLSLPLEGIFQNFCFVRVAAECPSPLDLLAALLENSALRRFRFLVAVDESIDVGDTGQVFWRIGNCVDPLRDIRMLHGPLAPWHDCVTPGHGAKMLVDATLKKHHAPIPDYPEPAGVERIRAVWRSIRR